MAFTAKELSQNENFLSAILRSAHELMAIYDENPRIASIFAAQQRWLLAHAGYALFLGYPDNPAPALYTGRFVDFAVKHKIASRNTAAAFLKEMIAYRFVRPIVGSSDRRITLLEPTEMTSEYLARWIYTHLLVLDMLDGGDRMARTTASAGSVLRMQPMIAKMILDSESLRDPGVTFALFNWATSGGVVMDYLISRISKIDPTSDKVLIGAISPKVIQSQFMISSAHLKRLLKQATDLGSVGWVGAPGRSSFWLSRNFVAEYWNYQAEKYAIVDTAYQAVLGLPDYSAQSSEEFLARALAISA
ncbi:hypothetical protein [Rhizobium mayense]|uniref:Uncharacterized protein n=1 Tax=Rhizobium mayense TaxID=1312184 RepID=A0ABT7JPE3_9HYPH|nr:hypothetical protein [Rhizobium mayense]MDL2398126.1 hypothetical protein [Rhizobium mayense]